MGTVSAAGCVRCSIWWHLTANLETKENNKTLIENLRNVRISCSALSLTNLGYYWKESVFRLFSGAGLSADYPFNTLKTDTFFSLKFSPFFPGTFASLAHYASVSRSLPRGKPFAPKCSFGKKTGLNPAERVALHFHYAKQPSRTSFRPPVFYSPFSHTHKTDAGSIPALTVSFIPSPGHTFLLPALYYQPFFKLIDPSKSKSKPKLAVLPADPCTGTSARPGASVLFITRTLPVKD